jgi:hypothetical protein
MLKSRKYLEAVATAMNNASNMFFANLSTFFFVMTK